MIESPIQLNQYRCHAVRNYGTCSAKLFMKNEMRNSAHDLDQGRMLMVYLPISDDIYRGGMPQPVCIGSPGLEIDRLIPGDAVISKCPGTYTASENRHNEGNS